MADLSLLSALAGGSEAFAKSREREAELAEILRQIAARQEIERIKQQALTEREDLRQTRLDERQRRGSRLRRKETRVRERARGRAAGRTQRRKARRGARKEFSEAAGAARAMDLAIPKRPRGVANILGAAAELEQQISELEKDRESARIKSRQKPGGPQRPRRPAFPSLSDFQSQVAAEMDRNKGGTAKTREEAIERVVLRNFGIHPADLPSYSGEVELYNLLRDAVQSAKEIGGSAGLLGLEPTE